MNEITSTTQALNYQTLKIKQLILQYIWKYGFWNKLPSRNHGMEFT